MQKLVCMSVLALLISASVWSTAQGFAPKCWANGKGVFCVDFSARTWQFSPSNGQAALKGDLFEVFEFGGDVSFTGSGEANVTGFINGNTASVTVESNSLGRFTVSGIIGGRK